MAVDYRGEQDDVLTLLFAGVSQGVLRRAFTFLCADGRGVARDFSIAEGHSPVWRMGYVNHWTEVALIDRDDRLASVDDVVTMAADIVARETGGRVDRYRLEDFLNLRHRNEHKIIGGRQALPTMSRKEVTERILREFAVTPTRILAERYGRSISAIDTMASRRGIRKTRYTNL